jgi:hypothetical protein
MICRTLILAAFVVAATPAAAETLPANPAEVMGRVMAVFSGIDRPPGDVLQDALPEAAAQDRVVSTLAAQGLDTGDPDAMYFEAYVPGSDPMGDDGALVSCIRFGPPTLAYAAQPGTPALGPMLMKLPAEGWIGETAADLPELGSPQVFPQGAILRQDCVVRFGVPVDMAVRTLKDWPAAAIKSIGGRFGTLTTTEIKAPAPNSRLGLRASDPQGDGAVRIVLMLGMMPYRPFDDPTLPAFGLELRAATYLFATGS